jgi:hypothetical protein
MADSPIHNESIGLMAKIIAERRKATRQRIVHRRINRHAGMPEIPARKHPAVPLVGRRQPQFEADLGSGLRLGDTNDPAERKCDFGRVAEAVFRRFERPGFLTCRNDCRVRRREFA